MNIEGTIELISNSSESFWSGGNIIAVIVSLISIIGSIIVVFLSNRAAKTISKENNELQKKMNDENTKLQSKWHKENLELQEQINKSNIDANLIAAARIEWIQNVRNITADLLTLYFSILNSADVEVIQTNFYASIQKTELLILYFGHEIKSLSSEDMSLLLNKENNNGKNELVVSFLVLLSEKFRGYYSDIKKGEVTKLEEALKQARNAMYNNATYVKIGENYNDFLEEMQDIMEPISQEEDIQYVASLKTKYENKVKQITEIQNDLVLLRNVIRTYLKIEWNKSKTGT